MKISHNMQAGDLIKGQAHLVAAIKDFKADTKAWHQSSHQVIASAVVHAHLTGDIRPISAVLKVMPNGAKTNSMRRYAEKFAPVRWSEVKKDFKFDGRKQRTNLLSGEAPLDVELLSAILNTHWSSMGTKEGADNYRPIDLQARLLRLVSDCNKELEGDNKDKSKITSEQLNQLTASVRALFPDAKVA